jgi:hypothetical protein
MRVSCTDWSLMMRPVALLVHFDAASTATRVNSRVIQRDRPVRESRNVNAAIHTAVGRTSQAAGRMSNSNCPTLLTPTRLKMRRRIRGSISPHLKWQRICLDDLRPK